MLINAKIREAKTREAKYSIWSHIKAYLSIKLHPANASPNSNSQPPSSSRTLLNLPLEIRLLVYAHLSNSRTLSRPCSNPLTILLHINHQLRYEVSSFFYTHRSSLSLSPTHDPQPNFIFLNAPRTLTFFHLTTSHLHLLRSLTLSVAYDNTYALERVWRFWWRGKCA